MAASRGSGVFVTAVLMGLVLVSLSADTGVEAHSWLRFARETMVTPMGNVLGTMQDAITKPWRSWSSRDAGGGAKQQVQRKWPQQTHRWAGRSADEPESASADGQSSNDTGDGSSKNNDYKTMCMFNRDPPKWKSTLDLHFFSSKAHSNDTLGCSKRHLKLQFDMHRFITEEGGEENIDDFLTGVSEGSSIRASLLSSGGGYNGSQVTYLLTHGFMADWSSDDWMCSVKDMVLNSSRANVFIVDWSGGSKPVLPIDYGAAVKSTQFVGRLLGAFVRALVRESGQKDASNMHLIGHSLGSHICGFIGYTVGSVGRITALDPAGPCFGQSKGNNEAQLAQDGQIASGTRRLSMQSANLVVALHTDTALFGLDENCAHFDIYVNGGANQPDCPSLDLVDKLDDLLHMRLTGGGGVGDLSISCAHSYAHSLIESIFPSGFGSVIFGLGEQVAMGPDQPNEGVIRDSEHEQFARCESLAYRCHSWSAYKSGECGLCEEPGDCIFIGLDSERIRPGAVSEALEGYEQYLETNKSGSRRNIPFDNNDIIDNDLDEETQDTDYSFNEELTKNKDDDENNNNNSDDAKKLQKAAQNLQLAKDLDKVSRGKHFIKTSDQVPKCLMQYQIIVAVLAGSQIDVIKDHFYVQIPIEEQTLAANDNGGRPEDRVIRVSHEIAEGSASYQKIEHFLRPQLDSQDNKDEQLIYYSALITFKVATNCDATRKKTSSQVNEGWSLCEPLQGLHEANVWSSNTKHLKAIRWVAINYMSAVSKHERRQYSRLLLPDSEPKVMARADHKRALRPQLSDLQEPKSQMFSADPLMMVGSVLNTALVKPAECIVTSMDPSKSGRSENNVKCMRSAEEMKYSLLVRAISRGDGTKRS